MSYRDMVSDAGYDPDSDEGRQMAEMIEMIEADRRRHLWEREQETSAIAWVRDLPPGNDEEEAPF